MFVCAYRTHRITITNFCLGKHLVSEDDLLKDQRGSPAYISPDVLSGECKIDMFKGQCVHQVNIKQGASEKCFYFLCHFQKCPRPKLSDDDHTTVSPILAATGHACTGVKTFPVSLNFPLSTFKKFKVMKCTQHSRFNGFPRSPVQRVLVRVTLVVPGSDPGIFFFFKEH